MIFIIFLIKRLIAKLRGSLWREPIVKCCFKSKSQVGLHQKLRLEGHKGGAWKWLKSVPRGSSCQRAGQDSCSHHWQCPGSRMQEKHLCSSCSAWGTGIPSDPSHQGMFHHLPTTASADPASLRLSVAIQTSLWFRGVFNSVGWNWSPIWERVPKVTGIRKAAHGL